MSESSKLASGAMKIELSQYDMAQAIEYWLNKQILKLEVSVTMLTREKQSVSSSATFSVIFVEKEVEQ